MAKFTSITVDAKKRVAEKYGFVLPGGDHPGVGVAGLTLGGGFGLISRQFGLMVDYLTEVRLVDAKGRVRVGVGQGNFGIVTSFKFNLIPAAGKSLTYQMYWWLNVTDPVARIKIVSNFIEETPKLPKDITCSLYLSSIDNHMSLTVARWNKNFTDGALNNTILGLPAANSTETKVFSSYVDLMLEVWFFRNWTKPAFMDRDQVRSVDAMVATSMYSEADPKSGTPMASNRSDALAHLVNEYLVNSQQFMGTIQLNTWGGAISKVPRKSTSFVHRGNYISYQALASVDKNGTAAPKQFLESWRRSMTPFIIPQAYQCYVDTSLPDRFYYGNENVPILKSIKKRVDPTNVWGYKGGLGGGRKGTCGNGLVGDGVCAAVGHYCMDNGICSNNGTFCSV
ncbi:hypothetical protein BDR26DRAFT_871526 [Obelidium mucronatum]|nr:hypothetical protein BDR26DRAFT_871526 [Obelidium mucronatum]